MVDCVDGEDLDWEEPGEELPSVWRVEPGPCERFHMETDRGVDVSCYRWRASAPCCRGVVLALHGLGSHTLFQVRHASRAALGRGPCLAKTAYRNNLPSQLSTPPWKTVSSHPLLTWRLTSSADVAHI